MIRVLAVLCALTLILASCTPAKERVDASSSASSQPGTAPASKIDSLLLSREETNALLNPQDASMDDQLSPVSKPPSNEVTSVTPTDCYVIVEGVSDKVFGKKITAFRGLEFTRSNLSPEKSNSMISESVALYPKAEDAAEVFQIFLNKFNSCGDVKGSFMTKRMYPGQPPAEFAVHPSYAGSDSARWQYTYIAPTGSGGHYSCGIMVSGNALIVATANGVTETDDLIAKILSKIGSKI